MEIKKLLVNDVAFSYRITKTKETVEITLDGQEKKIIITHLTYDEKTDTLYFYLDDKPSKAHVTVAYDAQGKKLWHVALPHAQASFLCTLQPEQQTSQDSGPTFIPAKRSDDQLTVKSPLAGRVSKVLTSTGQQVKIGEPLLLIESMKMENEICAPRSAFIKTIFIEQGNVVQPNQILIEFEKEGEGDAGAQSSHESKTIPDR